MNPLSTNHQPSVVVTGASSGIGRATVKRLIQESFLVFAGVRREQDAQSLVQEFGACVHPLMLDVTDARSIQIAAALVEEQVGAAGLCGLVNNAGVGVSCPLEYLPIEDLRQQFEVNVFGPLSMIQAFLPAIRKARGRIINIGSIGDRLTMPFGGALCASKYALASLNEALRQELFPFGIHVCLIEPASILTNAVDKLVSENKNRLSKMPTLARHRYEESFQKFTKQVMEQEKTGSPPSVVADAVLQALTDCYPRTRYLCGKKAHLLALFAWLLPERRFDQIRRALFGLPKKFGAASS